jgi:hypothetical protein
MSDGPSTDRLNIVHLRRSFLDVGPEAAGVMVIGEQGVERDGAGVDAG